MRRVVLIVVVAAVCAVAGALLVAPRPEEGFRFNNGAEPETLDPALMTGVPEHTIALALFEGLVTCDPKTLAPSPGIAERWDVSPDNLRYTFHLRASSWSNGDPLTAADFVYSWRRVLDPRTAARYAYQLYPIRNARAFNEGTQTDFAEVGVRAVDAHTIEVTLEQPTPYFLQLAAFETYMPVNRACVETFGAKWTRPGNLVSNGPFALRKWLPQDRIVMAKNPRYWDAEHVRLNSITAYAVTDAQTALVRYRTGSLDWINDLPAPLIPQLKQRPDYHKSPSLSTYFFRFNCTRKPFDDARVRMAFNLALDKAKLCEHVLHGEYEPAGAFVPPLLPPYQSPPGPGTDAKRAAELLAEAGYPGGRGFPAVTLLYNTSKRHEDIAVAAQAMWKDALGVQVNLLNQEWKVYLKTCDNLDYDIARSAWIGDYLDPNSFLDLFVTNGGNNRTGWSNARYDELIADAGRTADPAKRMALFREAEDILINKELPVMPVFFYSTLSLRSPAVQGFYDNVRNLHPFKWIHLGTSKPSAR